MIRQCPLGNERECRQRISGICEAFAASGAGRTLDADIAAGTTGDLEPSAAAPGGRTSPYKVGWGEQFKAVFVRSWKAMIKNPVVVKIRLIVREPG